MKNNYIFIGENLTVMNSDFFKNTINTVDTIYIDPPYNTKNNFSYQDTKEHEKWITFMKERLIFAHKLLKPTGVIFISIDDNEYAYLKVLCDEIFQYQNFIGTFITYQSQRSNAKHINTIHEYVLCYAKNKKNTKPFKIKRMLIPEDRIMINDILNEVKNDIKRFGIDVARTNLNLLIKKYCQERNISWLKNYSNIDENGNVYFGKDLSTPGIPRDVNIPEINLSLDALPTRGWSSDEKFKKLYNENKLVFKANRPYEKHLLIDSEDNAPSTLNNYSRQGTNDLNNLGLRDIFDTPKPVELIKYLIRLSTPIDGVVLDFFAGSGTTGQAVHEINKEDNTNINYILIQQEEQINKKTKAYAACIKNGISPEISNVLIYRIKTFLSLNNISDETIIIKKIGDKK